MAILNCDIPSSLVGALTREASAHGGVSHVVTTALSQYLNEPNHTLFHLRSLGRRPVQRCRHF
jgi:hypothetical protein